MVSTLMTITTNIMNEETSDSQREDKDPGSHLDRRDDDGKAASSPRCAIFKVCLAKLAVELGSIVNFKQGCQ